MTGRVACVAIVFLSVAVASAGAGLEATDPFEFFGPHISLSAPERQRLDRGDVVVRVLPARESEVAVFTASRTEATPDRLVAWTNTIAELIEGRLRSETESLVRVIRDRLEGGNP